VRIDSSAPPGEQRVAEYIKGVLEAEGIAVTWWRKRRRAPI
ncbi:MAG: hypothetical protein JWN34_5620, partial [Bryobacterales bacterium]|nr:hypothetical protein [Bryobacterales bacterium]